MSRKRKSKKGINPLVVIAVLLLFNFSYQLRNMDREPKDRRLFS